MVFALNIGGNYGRGYATDSNGNAWVTGRFQGSIDIDGDGNNDLTSNGGNDSYVAEFDRNGTLVFALNIGGVSNDYGRGYATDSNGNAWVTGGFQGSIDIDGDGNIDLTSNGRDSYLVKFSDYVVVTIDENITANAVVRTFLTTDPDTGNTFTYQLVAGMGDTDNDAFTIVGNQLQINSSPDFETQSSYSILVQTTDAGGLSYSENFTININDVNEALSLMNRMAKITKIYFCPTP
ncbi:MAG: cadherin repeat domain-containing protein [Hormoscilla sp. SP12CHS1]|nr:cadherin repeat domain-containing protein [Hormoscilla sp. SP12CHS1]